MNICNETAINRKVLFILLEKTRSGEYKVTERGVHESDDDIYMDLTRFELYNPKTNKTSHRYIVVCYNPREEKLNRYLPETIFGPGTEKIVDEFYDVLRKKQEELGIEDKWDEIIKKEFEEWKERRDSSK